MLSLGARCKVHHTHKTNRMFLWCAGAYARVVLGFIDDCSKPNSKVKLDRNHFLYIIELGAGSGKFSFFMLKVHRTRPVTLNH